MHCYLFSSYLSYHDSGYEKKNDGDRASGRHEVRGESPVGSHLGSGAFCFCCLSIRVGHKLLPAQAVPQPPSKSFGAGSPTPESICCLKCGRKINGEEEFWQGWLTDGKK